MSLTTAKNGDVTLGKARFEVCLSVAWELEAMAYALPTLLENAESDLVARCIAARFLSLSDVLMKAIFDDTEKTTDLEVTVSVRPRRRVDLV